ncbi:MAG: nuclear transport factor 2 family protein [Pyrinomonadaceae bacterium]
MKKYFAIVAIVCTFFLIACGAPEEPAENTGSGNSANTNAGSATAENSGAPSSMEPETDREVPKSKDAVASREQIEAKDASQAGLGPTDTIRALNDAVVKKDAAKIMSLISRASLAMIEKSAREQGKTVEQILTADDGAPMPVEREMQNETIDGDEAFVEVRNSVLGNFDKMFLVKEDGKWRIALDKIQAEMIRRMNEMQKNPPMPKQ